jgi:hypothetical protein
MSAAATPPGITEAAYQQLSDEEKRRLGYQRPLSDAEFSQLTPEQLQNLGFAPKVSGAPADFGGSVYSSSTPIQSSLDTDQPGATRLPTGVTFQHQNTNGKMPSDTSNPPAAQIIAAPGQTVGANFTPPSASAWTPVDESAAAWKPVQEAAQPGSVPSTWDVLKGDTREIPLASDEAAGKQGLQTIVQGFRDAAKGMWDTLATPPKNTAEKEISGLSPAMLPLYRTLVGAGHTAQEATQIVGAVHDINNSADPEGTYAKVAQQTAGQGAGQALAALATEGVIKVAPKVPALAADAADAGASAVRAGTRTVNKVLPRLPEAAGSAAGYAAGHAMGLPEAGIAGAVIGRTVGKAVGQALPPIQIPGEGFGLPNRVEGGPSVVPESDTTGVAPPPKPTVAQPAPAEPKKLGDLLNDALGGKPLEPNVPLKNQASAKSTAASSDLPDGFTPVKSSAIQGYKYDPANQHFEVITNTGGRYGKMGITPDQVGAFEGADSKGRAWGVLKNSPGAISTKNGAPRAVPMEARSATPEDVAPGETAPASQPKPAASGDLTDLLQRSLDQATSSKPNYVYRARDADETGVPLQPNSRAQATSDLQQAMGFAEPGQRSGDWGQVVRIDLNKLKPSDYVIHPHPDGMQWVQFKRPLSESEVTPFAGKGVGAKQNVGSNQVNQ